MSSYVPRLGLLALGLAAAPAFAQGPGPAPLPREAVAPAPLLTLDAALRRADRAAYANRIAQGQSDAQAAQRTAALRGVLPSVRLEGGYVRTTDPIGAFGTVLRQRAIAQADFDPAHLNHPAATPNYLGSAIVEQPLFNADAWLGRQAAARATAASRAATDWTRYSTRVDVIRAYYGAVLARELVATLDTAARAAHQHVRQAETLARNGVATRSDALLASVKAGDVDAQLLAARADAETAVQGLAVLLGTPGDTGFVLPDHLPVGDRVRLLAANVADPPADRRGDVRAARLGLDAARADLRRARSLYLPRLNSFARYDWNSPHDLYGGEKSWTVGVMASWSPFAGASELAEQQGAAGRLEAARAQADAATARAELEMARSERQLRVALAKLAIAEQATAQSAEAHRIVGRKYEGGLATVIELLDAAAVDTRTRLGLSHAVYDAIVADAERRQAFGLDPATLATPDN